MSARCSRSVPGSNAISPVGHLKEAIRNYFDSIRSNPAELYDELACILRPGDSIVTFNYDLGVERALHRSSLWDIETGYGFVIGNKGQRSP